MHGWDLIDLSITPPHPPPPSLQKSATVQGETKTSLQDPLPRTWEARAARGENGEQEFAAFYKVYMYDFKNC